ncbi:MAG: RDD family protein, partial [Vitreoscilla sp.]
VAGVGALVVQLRRRTPRRPLWRTVLMSLVLAWLVIVAFAHGADWLIHHDDPARVAAAAREDGDGDGDADDEVPTAAASSASTPASMPASATTVEEGAAARSARVAALAGDPAASRKAHPLHWRDDLLRRLHRVGLRFGWAIAYFTLLPTWWRGQTVGKRLFGLRVVQLTGKPLGLMDCFGRYGGYAAGLATGGIGLLQVLWDPNRQGVEDKLAHTVVVDLRGPRAS